MSDITDRNLLAGVLGLQLELYSSEQLVRGMQAWIFRKTDRIEEVLLSQGTLDARREQFLCRITEEHIRLFEGNLSQAIESLPVRLGIQRNLEEIPDQDLSESIGSWKKNTVLEDEGPVGLTEPFSPRKPGIRFEVLRFHAQGGLGRVSVAEDHELHREVALKEILPKHVDLKESRIRFLVEAEVTGKLEHPGIVPVYSLGVSKEGAPYYAMRLIRGESLKSSLAAAHRNRQHQSRREWILTVQGFVRRLIDVCHAIEYAHSRGVLHRDIKPANIMLGRYGETLVVDWGLAKTGTKREESAPPDEPTCVPLSGEGTADTRMGAIVGTLQYMSPEQAVGRLDELGPASDVFSLGATLFTILTGKPPVYGTTQHEVLEDLRSGRIPQARELDPAVPGALNGICSKALQFRIQDRYPSAAAMREDLERWLVDEPVLACKEPWIDRASRWIRRHRTASMVTVGILLTSLVSMIVINGVVQSKNQQLAAARDALKEERDRVIAERDRAQSNLLLAREMTWKMLDTAEKRLSAGRLQGNDQLALRKSLTESSLQGFRTLYEANQDDEVSKTMLARTARISSNLKRLENHYPEALQDMALSLQLQTRSSSESSSEAKDLLLNTHRDAFTLTKAMGRYEEARRHYQEGMTLVEEQLKLQPDDAATHRNAANFQIEWTTFLGDQLDPECLSANASAIDVYQSLYDTDPSLQNAVGLSLAIARRVKLHLDLPRWDGAELLCRSTVQKIETLCGQFPGDNNLTIAKSRCYYWAAELMADAGFADAQCREWASQATAQLEALYAKQSIQPYLYSLSESLRIQAKMDRLGGDLAQATKHIQASENSFLELIANADDGNSQEGLAKCLDEFAKIQRQEEDAAAAIVLWQRARDAQKLACKAFPENAWSARFLKHLEDALK